MEKERKVGKDEERKGESRRRRKGREVEEMRKGRKVGREWRKKGR